MAFKCCLGTGLQHAVHGRIKDLPHSSQLCLLLGPAEMPGQGSTTTTCPGSNIICFYCCWPGTISLTFATNVAEQDPLFFLGFYPLWGTRLLCVDSPAPSLCCVVEMSPWRATPHLLSLPLSSCKKVFWPRPHGAC